MKHPGIRGRLQPILILDRRFLFKVLRHPLCALWGIMHKLYWVSAGASEELSSCWGHDTQRLKLNAKTLEDKNSRLQILHYYYFFFHDWVPADKAMWFWTVTHNYGNRASGHTVQPAVSLVLVPTWDQKVSPSMTSARPFQEQCFQLQH